MTLGHDTWAEMSKQSKNESRVETLVKIPP